MARRSATPLANVTEPPRISCRRASAGTRGYAELRECLADQGVATFDLEPVFRAYRSANPDGAITLKDDGHWSPDGHRIVAEALYEHLRAGTLLATPSP